MEQATLPLSRWRPSPARAIKLLAGLWLFGIGEALLVASRLGNSPWTVLAQGVAKHTPLSIGTATIVLSGLVLLMWIPLRQRPGLGTILNAILVGISIDVTLGLLPHGLPLAARLGEVVAGVCAVGVASGLYLTSYLGPGPRDGLMTGLHRVTGVSIRVVRACIELTALLVGFALGGTVGIGTAAFALGIGPIVQEAIRIFGRGRPARHL
jgi:uncharacterized membrane protein YczE